MLTCIVNDKPGRHNIQNKQASGIFMCVLLAKKLSFVLPRELGDSFLPRICYLCLLFENVAVSQLHLEATNRTKHKYGMMSDSNDTHDNSMPCF